MSAEKSLNNTNLVGQKEPESDAQHARGRAESIAKAREAVPDIVKRGGDAHRDQHHPGDGAYTENQEIGNRPAGISNAGEDQQRHRRRARQPMNNAYHQGSQEQVEIFSPEHTIQPRHGRLI